MPMEVFYGSIWGWLVSLIIFFLALTRALPMISSEKKKTYGYLSIAMAIFLLAYYFYN
jgi:hypothetical protein